MSTERLLLTMDINNAITILHRFYVRDLDHVTQVIDKLVDFISMSGRGATRVLEKFLELCCLVSYLAVGKFVISSNNTISPCTHSL